MLLEPGEIRTARRLLACVVAKVAQATPRWHGLMVHQYGKIVISALNRVGTVREVLGRPPHREGHRYRRKGRRVDDADAFVLAKVQPVDRARGRRHAHEAQPAET